MDLYIRKLTLEKDGVISHKLSFNKGLTVIEESPDTLEILKLLLKGHSTTKFPYNLCFSAEIIIVKTYYVRGRKNKNELHWKLSVESENSAEDCFEEFRGLMSASIEIDSLSFFKSSGWQDYSHRLNKYLRLIYQNDNVFFKHTNSFSSTRTFRAFITQYIKHFKPIRLRENRDYYLVLKQNGVFAVYKGDSDESADLSENERMLSSYLCYLSLADFWERAERIRNLNTVTKPLVISDFMERLDESINTFEILNRTNRLSRQTILLVKRNRLSHFDL